MKDLRSKRWIILGGKSGSAKLTMHVDESVTVKGSPVRSLQKFIEAELTPAQREHVLAQMPPEYATRFRSPILATETVPVHMLNVFTEFAAKEKGEGVEAFARRAGREAAGEAVKGIYRFFALVLTPAALLSKGGQMWGALYNRGELRVDDQASNSARIRLINFPSELAGCSRMTGWIERMAQLTGVKDVIIEQTQCFAKGAPNCEWRITWK
jgi:predicted hydrocarbon binding protein